MPGAVSWAASWPTAWSLHGPPEPSQHPPTTGGLSYLHSAPLCGLGWQGPGAAAAPLSGLALLAEHGPVSGEAAGGCGGRGGARARAPLSASKSLQLDPPAPPTGQEIRCPPHSACPAPSLSKASSANPAPRPGFATHHCPSSCFRAPNLCPPLLHANRAPRNLTMGKLRPG